MTLIKREGRYHAEITISWSLEIVTSNWGRWVSEEDVTISKQTFRLVLYPLRRPRSQQFCHMRQPYFSKKNLISKGKLRSHLKRYSLLIKKRCVIVIQFYQLKYLVKAPFQEYLIISKRMEGDKLSNTKSVLSNVILGARREGLEEMWSISLNI